MFSLPGLAGAQERATETLALDEATARHFLNRFGFGGSREEVLSLRGQSPRAAFLDRLQRSSAPEPGDYLLINHIDYGIDRYGNEVMHAPINGLSSSDRAAIQRPLRDADKRQFRAYLGDWMQSILEDRDPLRDRMAFFWHGFFPSSFRSTLRCFELIRQSEKLRVLALSSFRDLLRCIISDPAMLVYFDNGENTRSHPHENFARELMELYSLGEGSYTERDVREAARCLTGFRGESGFFEFDCTSHDHEVKTIFGQSGRFTGFDLVDLILEQPACARHVSHHLLTHFEGVSPEAERLEEYAEQLRSHDYEFAPWLEKLACDPRFYSASKIGNRTSAPIEFIAGASRRTEIAVIPGFVYCAASTMGQELYVPPSVRGWMGGDDWVTPENLLMRSLCAGHMTGCLESLKPERRSSMMMSANNPAAVESASAYFSRRSEAARLTPPDTGALCMASGAPAKTDEEFCAWALSAWLPCRASSWSSTQALAALTRMRTEAGVPQGDLLVDPRAEDPLRRFAYYVLTLPEAHLW